MTRTIRHESWAFLALLFIATGARVHYFSGLQVGDDVVYSRIAMDHLRGDWGVWSVHAARRGFILPIVASFALFGHGETSLVLYNALCSIGTVVVAYFLARRFFGTVSACVAGLIVAVHPLLVFYASECHTDTPLAFWTALAVLLLARAETLAHPGRTLFLAGILLGWAYLTKEAIVAILPFFVGHALIRRHRWTRYIPLVSAGLVVVGMEWIYYAATIGNPFYRYWLIRELHTESFMNPVYSNWSSILFRVLLELPGRLFLVSPIHPESWHRLINLGCLIAGIYLWRKRLPGSRFLAGWFLSIFFFYAFWPSSFVPYRPGFQLYSWTLTVFVVPLACTLGGLLRSWNRYTVGASIALLMVGLLAAQGSRSGARRFGEGPRDAYTWITRENPAVVISDEKTLEAFDFFEAHQPKRRYRTFAQAGPNEKGVCVVDKIRFEPGRWWSVPMPPEVRTPPAGWRKMYESTHILLYEVGEVE